MALTIPERALTAGQYMRDHLCPGAVVKADLSAAIDAADDWLDTNLASLNSAIPAPFRTSASTTEKYMLLMYILMKRMSRF